MDRIARGQFATRVGIVVNILLGIVKVAAGVMGRSAALVADGIESLSDVVTSATVLVGFKMARKPADKEHPYGHGRAESLTGKIVAIAVIIVGCAIGYSGIRRLFTAQATEGPTLLALFVAGIGIAAKEALFQYKIRVAKNIGSTSLEANAWHHRSDAFSSIPVFIGIGAAMAGGPSLHFMDPLAAIITACVILWVGVSLFRKTWAELMDTAAPEKTIEEIRNIALKVPGVRDVEKIFSRKAGLDVFLDIHVDVDPDKTVREGHDIATAVKTAIIGKKPEVRSVLVHIEPFGITQPADKESGDSGPYDVAWRNFGC